jgi:hypothetical protein
MSVSVFIEKIRSMVQRQRCASAQMPPEGFAGREFRAMVFLNGRCLADVSMGLGQDEIFEPERHAALTAMGRCSGY